MAERSNAATPTVDVEDGDDIAPVLSDISDGDSVVLPHGTYDLRGDVSVDANDFTFHGNGSVIRTYEPYGHRLRLNGSGYEFSHVAFEPQNQDDDQIWLTLWPYGSDWHVHHLAWLSEKRVDAADLGSTIRPGVESGSEGNLTDIWLGAGVGDVDGNSHVHCFGSVDDDLWIRRTYFYQGGVYGANSSSDTVRNEGTTHLEDCYFENCFNTCARTGGHYQDTIIRNCVMNLSELSDVPSKPSYSSSYFRGVWAWHGPVILEDVHIEAGEDRALAVEDRQIVQESHIDYRSGAFTGDVQHPDEVRIDSAVGSDPKTTPPSDCVTSAEEAYVDSDDGSTDYDHTLEIRGSGTATHYEFTVSGDLAGGGDLEQWDTIDGSSADGWVTDSSHVDTYQFDGNVTDFTFTKGTATLIRDSEVVDPESLVPDPVPNEIVFDGTTLDGDATYSFEVTDDVEASGEQSDLESDDRIDGTSVSGTLGNGIDTYRYGGDLVSLSVDGAAVVRSDVASDSEPDGDYTIEIRGSGTATHYEFTVSGDLASGGDLEQWDTIDDSSADGWVTDSSHADTYQFDGSVTEFAFTRGAATVRIHRDGTS